MEENKKATSSPFDLSELADFQFGPAWARPGVEASRTYTAPAREHPDHKRNVPRRDQGDRPSFNRNKRPSSLPHSHTRPHRERVQPAEGFRVELRPVNNILEIFASKIQQQKRALPLLDLARIVMAGKDRYDVVFMRLDNGPTLIHSKQGDGACWLTEAEALAYLWSAPWFSEFYTAEQVETEAPKGSFSAIAICQLGHETIGPVNWHGYQAALMNLYRSKYSTMPLEAFREKITLNKDEETIASWLEQARHKTVWKPTRPDAADTMLQDTRAVEADFLEHHYNSVYEQVDKAFINGATSRQRLSPGLEAHLFIQSDKTRRFPQMLIPNLCHGLARHHMPIYKWQGNHFTGPSRVRTIPADTVLADRMTAIVNWTKEHSGEKVDTMFAALTGVPAGTDGESRNAATEAYAPYAADMIWLLDQGFLVVTSDNAIWFPKGEAAPAPTKPTKNKRNRKKAHAKEGKKPAPRQEQTNVPAPLSSDTEAPGAATPETPEEPEPHAEGAEPASDEPVPPSQ